MSTSQWITIVASILIMLISVSITGLLVRATNPKHKEAIDRILRPIGFVLAFMLAISVGGLLSLILLQKRTGTEPSDTPSVEACQDDRTVVQTVPVHGKEETIAILEVFHSTACRASWAQLTPALAARGAVLDVTLTISRKGSRMSISSSVQAEPLPVGTLADNGDCVIASVSVSSTIGSASARGRCLEVDGR